jgi:uncharacterized protein (DUF2147 family)
MFHRNLVLFGLIFLSLVAKGQSDKIVGVWINEEKDGQIEIYRSGNKYFGKIIDGRGIFESDGRTLKKDTKNPDANLRSRPLLNMVILSDFIFSDGEWNSGKIYDPKSGKTYSSSMKLKGTRLELRGYVGISLLGRTTAWERVR